MNLVQKVATYLAVISSVLGDVTSPSPENYRQSHSLTGGIHSILAPVPKLENHLYLGYSIDLNGNGKKDDGEPMTCVPYWERPVLSERHLVHILLPHCDAPVRTLVKEAYAKAILFSFNTVSPAAIDRSKEKKHFYPAPPFNPREYKQSVLDLKEEEFEIKPVYAMTPQGLEMVSPLRKIPKREFIEGKRMYIIECDVKGVSVGRASFFIEYDSIEKK